MHLTQIHTHTTVSQFQMKMYCGINVQFSNNNNNKKKKKKKRKPSTFSSMLKMEKLKFCHVKCGVLKEMTMIFFTIIHKITPPHNTFISISSYFFLNVNTEDFLS